MNLPETIQRHLTGKTGHTDEIGMSGSCVILYDDCVLKIEDVTPHMQTPIAMMDWMEGRIPAPRVLCHEITGGKSYLLMSRVPGKMSCALEYLEQPNILVSALAEGMRLLWQTDTSSCPRYRSLDDMLEEAAFRVENGLVDMVNAEPETFGEEGFRDPRHLLQWLRENRPAEVPVLAHGDYCLPNIFLDHGRFAGFIDVGDMGIGEKWRDIALCWRSLKHNFGGTYGGKAHPEFDPDILFQKLDIQPDWEQIRYHLLLDELL